MNILIVDRSLICSYKKTHEDYIRIIRKMEKQKHKGKLPRTANIRVSEDDVCCFIKEGDRWGFYGDSITAAGVYTRVLERVFRHFHPDADVTFINNAQGGKKAAGAEVEQAVRGNPNVVSIMLGINDAINGAWIKGMPVEAVLEKYREDIFRLVRGIKGLGKEVVLMTPTLTDETSSITIFRLAGTQSLVKMMGKVCEEIAMAEGIPCIPVQIDFEEFQDGLPLREQRLRYDGVHPTAVGQYGIARSLWERLNIQAPLTTGVRKTGKPAPRLPMGISIPSRILPTETPKIDFILSSPEPTEAAVSWSSAAGRGSGTVRIDSSTQWSPELPDGVFPGSDGFASDMVLEFLSGGRRAVFIVDISRNRVFHMKDGFFSGCIQGDRDNPPIRRVCDFSFKREGRGFLFEASVNDSKVVHDNVSNAWPWSGDAVTLYLDLRPGQRFAGLGLEGDVYQLWFQPRVSPAFSPGFRPWYGKCLENASTAFGEKTESGYRVGLIVDGWFNLHERFDAGKLDFIGIDLAVFRPDAVDGKQKCFSLQKTALPTFLYPNCFAVIDLNGTWKGDSMLAVNVFPCT